MSTSADFETHAEGKKPGDRLRCVVVTPERTVLDQLVEFVALPLFDGELGVLPGRSPLIGRLGYGEMRTRQAGATQRYFVDGGFAQVRDNVVTILTDHARPAESIDVEAAARDLEHAKMRHALTLNEHAEKAKAVARARGQIRVGSHRG
jgi:F-type H+-transporting ATPase subunit epsilon